MSVKNENTEKRRYRKRLRAEQEEETRRRITEAAVELHGSVGPARTTVAAVAEKAGVQRATVYRHFPDEQMLFNACSTHWLAENPLPDQESWGQIEDPDVRLATALTEIYAWYDRNAYMVEKTTRDASLVPALQAPMLAFAAWFEQVSRTLMAGRPERGRKRQLVTAAIGHSLAFETWRSLVQRQGLDQDAAVSLMCETIRAAAA